MNYTNIKSIIILTFLISLNAAFDSNLFPILKKLFTKNTYYNKIKKNYVSRGDAIKNRRNNNNDYNIMSYKDINLNLRNSTNISNITIDYSNYLNNKYRDFQIIN